jgi:hypothetical protein
VSGIAALQQPENIALEPGEAAVEVGDLPRIAQRGGGGVDGTRDLRGGETSTRSDTE